MLPINPLEMESLIERILSFLPMKELHNVASVCKMWFAEAQKEKQRRFALIAAFAFTRKTMEKVSEIMDNLAFQPNYIFCVGQRINHNDQNICKILFDIDFPKTCENIVFNVKNGIFYSNQTNNCSIQNENDASQMCILPKSHLYRIHSLYNYDNDNLQEFINGNYNPKLVINFETPLNLNISERDDSLNELCNNVPAIGCVVQQISSTTGSGVIGEGARKCCFIFEGNDLQVQAETISSALLGRSTEKVLNRQRILSRLGEGMRKENRICFMFTCYGSKYSGRHKSKENIALFHAMYPDVPVFGMYCYGEWGRKSSDLSKPPKYLSYSTVMAMVSLQAN